MRVWIIEIGESIPGIDQGAREWRCGMLSKALVAQGYEVTWWSSTFYHARKCQRFNKACVVEALPGLQIRFLYGPGYANNKSLKRIFHHIIVAEAFAREAIKNNKPDVIFCCLPNLELADQVVKYGKKASVPVLIDIRDLWPDHYLSLVPKWARGLAKAALFTEYRRVRVLLRDATGITAISETFLKWALRHAGRERRGSDEVFHMSYPELSSHLQAQVDIRQSELIVQYNFQPKDVLITFMGTFVSSFNLETVIEAAGRLQRDGQRNIRFMLVGEGDAGPRLRAQAEGLTNITFTGWFDQLSIVALLRLSAAGLAPYRDDTSISLPNKPFEYMAAGLPLLSSLRGELETLIRDELIGLQYRAGDPRSLVEMVRWLSQQGMSVEGASLFEVGTGHIPLVPIGFSLSGTAQTITVDLHRRIDCGLTRDSLEWKATHRSDVWALYDGLVAESVFNERFNLLVRIAMLNKIIIAPLYTALILDDDYENLDCDHI